MWASGKSWSGVRSSRKVHSAFQLLFYLTWLPDQKSPLMWMHFKIVTINFLRSVYFSAWNTTSSSCFYFINLSGSVSWRLNQPTVRLVSFNIPLSPISGNSSWNLRMSDILWHWIWTYFVKFRTEIWSRWLSPTGRPF